MAKINSRQKGANFELTIAKKFNDWCGNRWTFRRSPLSGGWDPKAQTGDIFPLELKDAWPFIIEVRKNEQYTLDTLLKDSGIVAKWFNEKCVLYEKHANENRLSYKPVIFVMCRNRVDPVVVFSGQDMQYIFPSLENIVFKHIRLKIGELNVLYIVDLDVFLSNFKVPEFLV